MDIHRKLIFILLLPNTSLSFAATEFETTVPVNLVRYLTGGIAYSDLPDDFPPFVVPDGLSFIGSEDSPSRQLVLLRTSRGGAESQAAIAEALMAEGGWLTLAPVGSQRQNGFVVSADALRPVSLCHDQFGELEIRGEGEDSIENRVYIQRFNRTGQPGWLGCAALNESRAVGRSFPPNVANSIVQYMPSFAFLVEAAPSRPQAFVPQRALIAGNPGLLIGGRSSRNGSGFESKLRIPANSRAANDINGLVIKQLREEGWELDAQWQGDAGAGSNWVRTTETDMKLFLSFLVMATRTDDYEARIKLTELEQPD